MSPNASHFWQGKTAVITGGTAGLGLALAREFVSQGVSVGLVARNSGRLDAIVSELSAAGPEVVGETADVCDGGEAGRAISGLASRLGRIDVLINNVGVSSRFDIQAAGAGDYLAALRSNLFSAVHCTAAAMPELLVRRGSVVNIASLSAKTAWPFMAPYGVSKAALAAYSHQLRLELGSRLHVLLVCPGPLRRGDAGIRYNSQAAGLPARAAAAGAGAQLRGIPPEKLAARIRQAIERRRAELVLPGWARLAFALAELSPALGDWLLRRFGAAQSSSDSRPQIQENGSISPIGPTTSVVPESPGPIHESPP